MTRYSKLLLFGLLVAFLSQSPVPAQQAAPTVPVSAVGAIGMTVSDLDRSVEFYSQVLSFQKISDVEVIAPLHTSSRRGRLDHRSIRRVRAGPG